MDDVQGLLPPQKCLFPRNLHGTAPEATTPTLDSSREPGGLTHSDTAHAAGMPTTPWHPSLPPGKGWQVMWALPAPSTLLLTSSDANTVLLPGHLRPGDACGLTGQHRAGVDHHHHQARQGLQGRGLCEGQGSATLGRGCRTPSSTTLVPCIPCTVSQRCFRAVPAALRAVQV